MHVTAIVAGLAAAAVLAPAGSAAADTPTGGTNAADIVKHLQDEGYTVQLNMPSEMALSRCTVSGISGLTLMMTDAGLMAMMAPVGSRGTAYVTLSCPTDSNN